MIGTTAYRGEMETAYGGTAVVKPGAARARFGASTGAALSKQSVDTPMNWEGVCMAVTWLVVSLCVYFWHGSARLQTPPPPYMRQSSLQFGHRDENSISDSILSTRITERIIAGNDCFCGAVRMGVTVCGAPDAGAVIAI
jgi:hypothetical protein